MTSLASQELYSEKVLIMFLFCGEVEAIFSGGGEGLSRDLSSVIFSLVNDMLLLVVLAFSLSGHFMRCFSLTGRAVSGARQGKGAGGTTPRATEICSYSYSNVS